MGKTGALFLAGLMAASGTGLAQENPNEPGPGNPKSEVKSTGKPLSGKKLDPIEFRQIGPEKKPSQDYFYEGERLETFQQLTDVVDALKDPEASRLLKDSKGKETAGTIFNVAGGLLVVGSILYGVTAQGTPGTPTYLPYGGAIPNTNPPDLTPSWILGGAGAVVELVGIIFTATGEQNRRDAVNRYNHLVAPDRDLSMVLMPGGRAPGLEWTQRF